MAEGDIHVYGNGISKIITGEIDFDTHTMKAALLAGHTLATDTHDYFNDVSADEESGTGYTTGGETLGSKTVTFTAANSWSEAWAASTAYAVGDIVRPTTGNGYVYRCFVAGTSAGSEPTWSTTPGDNVTDNTAEWEVFGTGIIAVDSADVTWTGLDVGTPSHTVVYRDTGVTTTSPLLLAMELSTASNGGNYTVQWPADGMLTIGVFN